MNLLTRAAHELRLLCVALQYFTRLPMPSLRAFDATWLSQSVRYFPVAGWIVGGIGAGVLWLCAQTLPIALAALLALVALVLWGAAHFFGALLAVLLSVVATVWLTGAFHEDGLADTFDALGGHVPRERALQIMRDSRIGTYGAAALGIVLLLRWQTLAALPLSTAAIVLPCAHAAARAGAASLMATLPYVRLEDDAKAKPVVQDLAIGNLLAMLGFGAAPMLVAIGLMPALAVPLAAGAAASVLVRVACARWFRIRLGGYTGDTLGCCEQFGEIAFVLAVIAVSRWTM
jgi:adenosylcobinamide-GDP ribazoletransferase